MLGLDQDLADLARKQELTADHMHRFHRLQTISVVAIPTRLFPTRSQLIFVSPLLAADVELLIRLRARGYQLLIISPDPLTFELAEFTATDQFRLAIRLAQLERTLMLDQLRQADIQVMDWDVTTPFEEAAQRALAPGARL